MIRNIKNIRTISVVVLALAAAGCGKTAVPETVTGFPEDGVVRIAAMAGEPQTRADGSEYDGSTLGLFIDYRAGIENARYTRSNVKWINGTDGWTPEKRMLWKNPTASADIYAYAPYIDGATDAKNLVFSIPADQSVGTTAADLMSWGQAGFVPNNENQNFVDGKIMISFSHRLVKMTFNFGKGNQFGSDVTVKEVVLLGTASKVICDATTDRNPVVTAHSDAVSLDITLHKLEDLKYEAVFFPGKGQEAGVKMLKVTMSDGTVLFYTVPGTGLVSGGLMPGSAYTMKMRLGKDKIELAKDGITVGEWTEAPDALPGGETQINGSTWDGTVATAFESGDGSTDAPYIVSTASQLAYLARQVNAGTNYSGKYFKLTQNLMLDGKVWTPIGNKYEYNDPTAPCFSGIFDGGGYAIYGLKVESSDIPAGLFGVLVGGTVQNVSIVDAEVQAKNNAGILCGFAIGDVKISGCEVSGKVAVGITRAGGVVGELMEDMEDNGKTPIMENCKAKVEVKGDSMIGGLCGTVCGATISDCHVIDGMVHGTNTNIGGLVGNLSGKGSLKGCGFSGTIVKKDERVENIGAAFGYDDSDVTFTDCWYNADKTGDLAPVGKAKDGKDYSGIEAKHLGK